MEINKNFTRKLEEIGLKDLSTVGGKNASLGEMFNALADKGIRIPDGFVITSHAYWSLIDENDIRTGLEELLKELDRKEYSNLTTIGPACRALILSSSIPKAVVAEIKSVYTLLLKTYDYEIQVAVRSSATAEDLPEASFAGQQESYLNIESEEELIDACLNCYASLFTDRAIKYREDQGYTHMDVALSIGVQKMVRSDLACAGVSFTLDTETGFENVVNISASYGLGENLVKGTVTPDEYCVFKPAMRNGKRAILSKRLGAKEKTMTYALKERKGQNNFDKKTINADTPMEKRAIYALNDQEIMQLADWSMTIEKHYKTPMDIEWAKDGLDGQLYVVQARPETVHTQRSTYEFSNFKLKEKGEVLVQGLNVGSKIASGKVRKLDSPKEIDRIEKGDILVTSITNPDWDPIMKKASAIITDRGGRTSHAAIVAREMGAVAVVGTGNSTEVLKDDQEVTVSCADGKKGLIYKGLLEWDETKLDTREIHLPETKVMFILADPDQAFKLSFLPNNGVGLMRLEFVIDHAIQIHPMALVNFHKLEDKEAKRHIEMLTKGYENKEEYFTDKLSQAVATIAAAFYPKEVIVRMSDFKSNEYAALIGGQQFEPHEENPMIGWRGASRYYSEGYKEGFRLECKAMRIVREEMGLDNVKLMIPFCRTLEEADKVIKTLTTFGLERGKNGLELYMMVEIPSNVLLAKEFSERFDGFSIGSNDLTQLTLGIDRDSELLSSQFDAKNDAVKKLIAEVIKVANRTGTHIGLCGQAPSDSPEFAAFLVKAGIDSVSFNPDALVKGIESISRAEMIVST